MNGIGKGVVHCVFFLLRLCCNIFFLHLASKVLLVIKIKALFSFLTLQLCLGLKFLIYIVLSVFMKTIK